MFTVAFDMTKNLVYGCLIISTSISIIQVLYLYDISSHHFPGIFVFQSSLLGSCKDYGADREHQRSTENH